VLAQVYGPTHGES